MARAGAELEVPRHRNKHSTNTLYVNEAADATFDEESASGFRQMTAR